MGVLQESERLLVPVNQPQNVLPRLRLPLFSSNAQHGRVPAHLCALERERVAVPAGVGSYLAGGETAVGPEGDGRFEDEP